MLKGHIVRNPTLPLGLSPLLLVFQLQNLQASAEPSRPRTNVQDAKARPQPAATTATDTAKTLLPGQFILQEGTPVKLRLSRNVSCADAHEGGSVDFERDRWLLVASQKLNRSAGWAEMAS